MEVSVMKKLVLCLIFLGVFLFGVAVNSHAYAPLFGETIEGKFIADRDNGVYGTYDAFFEGYFGTLWDGYYLGTVTGANESISLLEALISFYLEESFSITDWVKVDIDDSELGSDGFETDDWLTVYWNEGGLDGSWETTPPDALGFYTVKGSNEFALYWITPPQTSGDWTTVHLLAGNDNNPQISHFSGVKTTVYVPEPASMLLMGAGLIAFAVIRRKRNRA
jgi:hypothetical protein